MPFLLSVAVQNDPQLMAIVNQSGLFKQLTPAVRDFVANPGSSITVSLAPPTPVELQAHHRRRREHARAAWSKCSA